jgi:apolipoprotein N-acyltransferase
MTRTAAPRPKRQSKPASVAASLEPSHGGVTIHRHVSLIGFAALSLLLQTVIFAPIGLWPFAFVCLAPWLIMIGASRSAPRVYAYSFLMGLAFYLINMRWMIPATWEGYVALSIYQALYFPLLACPTRHIVRRRGWPLAIAFPLIWTAGEMLRAVVLSGFPWFFLAHSLYRVLPLIQVSDLVGAYGASFVVAAVNGAVADLFLARLRPPPEPGWGPAPMDYSRRARISSGVAAALLVATLAYGAVQLLRDTTQPGPTAAILQGDFLMTVHDEEVNDTRKSEIYFAMLEEAAKRKPDLYVLPETPWIMYLNHEARDFFRMSRESFAALQRHARTHDAYVVTGSASLIQTPFDLLTEERRYNSAMVFAPDGSVPGRYDKVHLVYFGEVVPFRFGRLRPLYFLLNRMMPFSNNGELEYSLFPGDGFHTFSIKARSLQNREFRFGIPICYEDVMPYVARQFTDGGDKKRVDFLLNISNDGWFGRGIQQPQHLAVCVFRAIENRIGIARAVNTGVSAFIDPSGKVHHQVDGDPDHRWPGKCGFQVAQLTVDSRYSLYTRFGDWFGWTCALFLLLFYVDYWIARARAFSDED